MSEAQAVCICDGNGSAQCWQCDGRGGFHNCGEDTCCCLDKEAITEKCSECGGEGFFSCPVCAMDDYYTTE